MAVAIEARDRLGDCPVMLVSDIDRGGSFAHLLGTFECLAEEERALIRGFVLNRFRGDAALLHPAPAWLHERTGVPVVGVVPMLGVPLPEEDGVAFERPATAADEFIAVVGLPRASNIDEFAPLGALVRVVRTPDELRGAAGVVLPGSKSTIADLDWLRTTGLAGAIGRLAGRGVPVLGICGGMQMLGAGIDDDAGSDSSACRVRRRARSARPAHGDGVRQGVAGSDVPRRVGQRPRGLRDPRRPHRGRRDADHVARRATGRLALRERDRRVRGTACSRTRAGWCGSSSSAVWSRPPDSTTSMPRLDAIATAVSASLDLTPFGF